MPFALSESFPTHGCLARNVTKALSRRFLSGSGAVTFSALRMRSSYSTPCSLSLPMSRPRARFFCAKRITSGVSATASMTDKTSSAKASSSNLSPAICASSVPPCRSNSRGTVSTAKSASGLTNENSVCKSTSKRTMRPFASGASSSSTMPRSRSERYTAMARRWSLRRRRREEDGRRPPVPTSTRESKSRKCSFPSTFSRASTLSTIWCETAKEEVRGEGGEDRSESNVSSVQFLNPFSGGFSFLSFFLFPPFSIFSAILRFSATCSGAWHHTSPSWSPKPRRPARPAIC
mmetsp:Transcript_17204/g.56316  ORF Transcript_17204/g.56316 Transcript_17204/m.56316 type:complete len:291 (+) Transcript_17204:634-1506(+)